MVQPSGLSISRTFSSPQTETLYPLNSNSPSFPQAPDNRYSTFCLYEFTYSKYSQWNHTVLVLFCQTPHFFGWGIGPREGSSSPKVTQQTGGRVRTRFQVSWLPAGSAFPGVSETPPTIPWSWLNPVFSLGSACLLPTTHPSFVLSPSSKASPPSASSSLTDSHQQTEWSWPMARFSSSEPWASL